MTRKEQTGIRHLEFSEWIRNECPASQLGFSVYNLDWIFHNWKTTPKKLMIAEEKTYNGQVKLGFNILVKNIIEPALQEFCSQRSIDFRGYHTIIFEHTNPKDGKIWLDDKEISEDELKKFLAMED